MPVGAAKVRHAGVRCAEMCMSGAAAAAPSVAAASAAATTPSVAATSAATTAFAATPSSAASAASAPSPMTGERNVGCAERERDGAEAYGNSQNGEIFVDHTHGGLLPFGTFFGPHCQREFTRRRSTTSTAMLRCTSKTSLVCGRYYCSI
jgi:hypothetical protein